MLTLAVSHSHACCQGHNTNDPSSLLSQGGKLTATDAELLQLEVEKNPNKIESRLKLLGYYFAKSFGSDAIRLARQNHALWIIENEPDLLKYGDIPFISLDKEYDGQAYTQARRLWLNHIKRNDTNTRILSNAASFFLLDDENITEDLLLRAQEVEPQNPKWPERLGFLYSLGIDYKADGIRKRVSLKSLQYFEQALFLTAEEWQKFYLFQDLAEAAFNAELMPKASSYATELLRLAEEYQNDWNYGNAIYHGNLILGRIALKSSNVEKAKQHLLSSIDLTVLPQTRILDLDMSLASELLENGESQTVIDFLDACRPFWKKDKRILDRWQSEILNGTRPDFLSSYY